MVSEFTITVAVLGLPGIVCYFLTRKLSSGRSRNTLEVFLLIFLYSMLSYCLFAVVCSLCGLVSEMSSMPSILEVALSDEKELSSKQLMGGIGSGAALAYLLAYARRLGVANWVGQKIGATKRYGDEDVWEYFHNAPEKEKNDGWLMVRDHKCSLVYYGCVSVWSESGEERELVLSDVGVYSDEDGGFLYSAEHMYLSRARDDLTIEVPPASRAQLKEYGVDNMGE